MHCVQVFVGADVFRPSITAFDLISFSILPFSSYIVYPLCPVKAYAFLAGKTTHLRLILHLEWAANSGLPDNGSVRCVKGDQLGIRRLPSSLK